MHFTKRTFFLILCTGAIAIANAQSRPVRELAPGVFYYFGDELQQKSANCTWIVFKDFVLAIDANYPWGAEEIISEIKKTTSKPIRFLFDTHYHHDHTFGNSIFVDAGATIVSTRKAADEMHTLGQYEWDHGSEYSGRDMKNYRREFPSLTFDQQIVFDDGEHRVELIKMGPAHSGGDGVAYLPKEKILVTGDLCINGNPWGNNVADDDVDYDKWLDVLQKMAGWKVSLVVPGHGDLGTVQTLIEQRSYLKDLLNQVRNGIKAGKTKDQLTKEIDLGKHPVYGANKVSTTRSIGAMYDNLSKKIRQSKNAKPVDSIYTWRRASADGTGKFYLGREIAHVMDASGSKWLERNERQKEENTALAIEKIKLSPTDVVADIGAGTGYYTFRLSPKVPQGKVYAVEIQDEFITYLRNKKKSVKDSVVEVIKGAETSPKLPDNSVDLAIMVDVYHELEFPHEMLQSLRKALKPNGRILFLEYRGEDPSIPIRALHKTTVAQLNKELKANGFRLQRVEEFLPIQHFMLYEKN